MGKAVNELLTFSPRLLRVRHCCRLTQHSLHRRPATALPGPDLHRLIAPASAGAFAYQAPKALATFQKGEIEKWWPIIKEAGIKAQ